MNWRERFFHHRPLVAMAAAAMMGILISEQIPATGRLWWWMLPLVLIGLLLLKRLTFSVWLLILVPPVFLIGHQFHLRETRDHPWHQWLHEQKHPVYVEVEGTLERPLRRNLPGTEAGESLFRVASLNAFSPDLPADNSTYVCLKTEGEELLPVARYRITGWLKLPPPKDNPGQFDSRSYDLRLGLIGNLQASHLEVIGPVHWDIKASLFAASERSRAWLTDVLGRHLPADSMERVIILAMALGATDTAPPELQVPFRLSGTLHIFAVSGLHVVIIGMVFWVMLKCLFLPRQYIVLVLIPILFGYVFITGLSSSALRAAIMSAVVLLGTLLERRADTLNSLGAAALLLLILDTNQLFSPGFQLSFGVVAAIALLNQPFTRPFLRFTEPDAFMPKSLLTWWQLMMWSKRRWLTGLLTVSAAAWIGSLPFTLFHFHLATPVSLLSNLVLVPLAFVVLSLAVLTAAVSVVPLGFVQWSFSGLNYWFAKWTLLSAQFFAGIPGGHFYMAGPEYFSRPPAQITVLRMSAGNAANHLRIGNEDWLLDCGSGKQFPFVLAPYLQHQGINRLEALAISHADSEHRGAAPQVLQSTPFARLIEPWSNVNRRLKTEDGNAEFPPKHINHSILSRGDVLRFNSSAEAAADARAEVLYPPKDLLVRIADDRSFVWRLHIRGFTILWCNDAGFITEKYLLQNQPTGSLKSDIIIRNQHGSDFSMLPEFLQAVAPKAVISSNPNFPVEQMISRSLRDNCAKQNIQLIDQSETGAVIIKFLPEQLEIHPFRGEMQPFFIKQAGTQESR